MFTVQELADVVRADDVVRVREMLKLRPELAAMDMAENDEHQALHYAVLNRSPEMVRVLMEHGADARKGIWPNREATSALTIAIERGYDEIVAVIVGGMPEEIDETPGPVKDSEIQDAIRRNDEGWMIAKLEAHPEWIHFRHHLDGTTPLHAASALLWEQAARWLLDHGADVNAGNQWGAMPIDIVGCGRGCGKTGTPEQVAAMSELLLQHGAERTPRWAIATGNADWLRARHAEGSLTNAGGLLTLAVRYERPEILTLLLELGFDPDERTRLKLEEDVYSSGAPLHLCAGSGKLAMAEILLSHGANPNAEVYAEGSVMCKAYVQKDWDMVKLLESHGGALDAASVGFLGQTELARRMIENDAVGSKVASTLLWTGAGGGDPEIVRMALEHIDWPRDDRRWHWPLWQAFTSGAGLERGLACFRLLLERADVNTNTFGRTLLHDAMGSGKRVEKEQRLAFARVLLDAGARLDQRDELLGSTPLGWASRWGRVELVQLLLDRGADPIEADAEPWATPRAWAQKMKHDDVLALLRASVP